MAGKGSELALRRAGRTRDRARELASGDARVVEDKGGARLEELLAEPNRVRRVENIREGMREADSAHATTPVMKRPGDSASFRISACPTLVDAKIAAWEGIPRSWAAHDTHPARHGYSLPLSKPSVTVSFYRPAD
jgi:hypothetical protein